MFAGLAGKLSSGFDGIPFRHRDRVGRSSSTRRRCGSSSSAPSPRRRVRTLARLHNLARHRPRRLDAGRRPHRRHQHLGRPGHEDLAVRPTRRDGRPCIKDRPMPHKALAPLKPRLNRAQRRSGMMPAFVAFPGTLSSATGHYAVFMRGDTPLTSRLFKPVLIDADDRRFHRQPRTAVVCHDAAGLAAAAFRRLRRDAAEDHLGAARHRDHHRPDHRPLSLDGAPSCTIPHRRLPLSAAWKNRRDDIAPTSHAAS